MNKKFFLSRSVRSSAIGLFAICALLLAIGAPMVLAQTGQVNLSNSVPDLASAQSTGSASGDFIGWVQSFYQFSLIAAVFLAVGVIVWAGLRYALAAGNPSTQSDARDQILQALLGLILLFGAYLILYTINPNLVKLNLPKLQSVSVQSARNTTVETGGILSRVAVGVTDTQAGQIFLRNRVDVKPGASLYGLKELTIDEVVNLRNECGCGVTVTEGTGGVHQSGEFSHANGYKVDLRVSPALDNHIQSNFPFVGTRSDGARMYRAPSGAIYAREGDHWDVVVK